MDGLFINTGIQAVASSISMIGSLDVRTNPTKASAVGRPAVEKSALAPPPPQKTASSSSSRFSFRYPLRSLWPGAARGSNRHGGLALDDAVLADITENQTPAEGGVEKSGITTETATSSEEQNGSWVLKILHVGSIWKGEEQWKKLEIMEEDKSVQSNQEISADNDDRECDACKIDDDEEEQKKIDRDSFSNLLKRVSFKDAKLYAKLSYLGNLAYSIPSIKPANLLRTQGLRYVTSSIEKKELAAQAEKDQASAERQDADGTTEDVVDDKEQKTSGIQISASAAYHIAASAASYLDSHTKNVIPFRSLKPKGTVDEAGNGTERVDIMDSDMASLMATTDSVTAVVAAKEEVKQAVADDLNSTRSSPCEWFICDDDQSGTRFFVIQGSESLESWQANLLFEPIQFEGLDVLAHRGIYEAAKGIYEQMLPEVHSHLQSRGKSATFRFTGHSLGGSLALLVNLMLLIREEVPLSLLLPVITFGSPSIMCGGDKLLRQLGLPKSHVQAIVLHRDIVPRAFSCNYPNHVAELLKAVNKNFRNHPCLNNQKLLYAPMGELLILQPDEKFSPQHDLLPSGCGLYILSCPLSDNSSEEKLRSAQFMFLNSPHPLEILRDRSAYGSGGSIQRDHDMNSYVKSVRSVIRQELTCMRKAKREHRRKVWWQLVAPRSGSANIIVGESAVSLNFDQKQLKFSGMLQTGRESLKRFSRLVASQHMHLLVVLLFPIYTLGCIVFH